MRESIAPQTSDITSALGGYAIDLASSTTSAIAVAFLGFVLMIYLLIEARETRDWLNVPAALLLALMAGICDFVPVLGFILSAAPAILLALTVSGTTTLLVAAAYVIYNAVEACKLG